MTRLVGRYQHYKSENVDQYFAAIGIPYLLRKIITSSSPLLVISKDENEKWAIQVHTFMRTIESKFKIGEEFEESMPFGGLMKSKAVLEDEKLIIYTTIVNSGVKMTRTYECIDQECIITMNYEDTVTAKRYFKRVS